MAKAIDLPELQEGLLGPGEVQALFADLAGRVTVTSVVTKGGEMERAVVGPTLEDARARLVAQSVHGVQVRYLFAGREWCDTLLWVGNQVRLIRQETSALPRPGSSDS